jgi:hypothetical protein
VSLQSWRTQEKPCLDLYQRSPRTQRNRDSRGPQGVKDVSTSTDKPAVTGDALPELFASAFEYLVDTGQRSVLFLEVMRQRGVQYREHLAETAPHVLNYAVELIVDGRNFKQPVNYALVRIAPPSGVEIDLKRRPFVVVDPRAGHGPGIGGFKADSEIGVAMKAGHPCYFIGFLPEPMPGQTIEDIARAEAIFIEKVIALHPDADGKPCVIGNCQAGWAVMILASLRPELFGPIIVAGAPLSYWAGVRGKYPMRYSGGMLGGSWLTALTSDLGGGKFDGAWLVQNFENMNPSNTLWTKQYNVYSKVDTEADRYLEFERWWGAIIWPRGASRHPTARSLIFGRSVRRSSCSVQRVITSRRRSRHSVGFLISTAISTRSGPTGKPSSTPFTRRSDTSEYSSPAALPKKSTANFRATST